MRKTFCENGILYEKRDEKIYLVDGKQCKDKKIVIPSGVFAICEGAFERVETLEEVVIPDSVVSIEKEAFSNCVNLKKAVLGNSVREIYGFAFYKCAALSNINFPNSLICISAFAFYMTDSLVSVKLNEGLEIVGNYAFEGSAVKEFVVPTSVKTVGLSAFSGTNDTVVRYQNNNIEEPLPTVCNSSALINNDPKRNIINLILSNGDSFIVPNYGPEDIVYKYTDNIDEDELALEIGKIEDFLEIGIELSLALFEKKKKGKKFLKKYLNNVADYMIKNGREDEFLDMVTELKPSNARLERLKEHICKSDYSADAKAALITCMSGKLKKSFAL